jgi:MoaA/NifB/PqqE/SkfB family radical SAM enzyme
MIRFSWDISYLCNYRCPYCWWDPHWEGLAQVYPSYPSVDDWIACWRRVAERHGAVEIEILGGEPLHFARFDELMESVTAVHHVNITSNLSLPEDRLRQLLRRVRKDRFRLAASYHPQFAEFGPFLDRVGLFHREGVASPVLFVAYPPNLAQIPAWKARVDALGYPSTVWVFTGRYNGRDYPESYTEAEWALLRPFLPPARASYNLERKPTLGKPCLSGHLYANIKPNGDVYRCGQAATTKISMGNIFDDGFRMMDGATPCPMVKCVCSEYIFLVEEWSKPGGESELVRTASGAEAAS